MAYTKHTWVDRQGIGLNKFTDQNGNNYEFTPNPDSITQTGTPFSASWMNNIENGIADHVNKINKQLYSLPGVVVGETVNGDFSELSNYNLYYVELGAGKPLGLVYRAGYSHTIEGTLSLFLGASLLQYPCVIDFDNTRMRYTGLSGIEIYNGSINTLTYSTIDFLIYGIV